MLAFRSGGDLAVILRGGQAHVGAIAMADGHSAEMLERAGHRDGQVALDVAQTLARGLGCTVAASCGIHYDGISSAEIAAVLEMAHGLAEELLMREAENAEHGGTGSV